MLEDAAADMRSAGARDLLVLALIVARRAAPAYDDGVTVGIAEHAMWRRLIAGLSEIAGTDADGLGLSSHVRGW